MTFTAQQIADRIERNIADGEGTCPALRWAMFDCEYPEYNVWLEACTIQGINPKTAYRQYRDAIKQRDELVAEFGE